MTPDDLESRLRAARPKLPASLRARVLAAAMAAPVYEAAPWWAKARTWAAAAVLAVAADAAFLTWPKDTALGRDLSTLAHRRDADEQEVVPRPMPGLAWIVPVHVPDPNVPTPRSTLMEIYR